MKSLKQFGWFAVMFIALFIVTKPVHATDSIQYSGKTVGTYNDAGEILYKPQSSASANASALSYLLNNDKEKTVILSGNIETNRFKIGNNTAIKADGATIVGTSILANTVDGSGQYDALKNVTISGGTWILDSDDTYTMMRLTDAQNLTFSGLTMTNNYKSHAIELIACKDVKITDCKIYVSGTKPETSVEESVQIDVATQTTAPNVWKEITESIQNKIYGHTCDNIEISDSYIEGSRGVCANYSKNDTNFFHSNIRITNNVIVGKVSEAVALFNSDYVTVTGNTLKTESTRTDNASYTRGLNLVIMGSASSNLHTVTIQNNNVSGVEYGINITTKTSTLYNGEVNISNNIIYCKNGAANNIRASKSAVNYNNYTTTGNQTLSEDIAVSNGDIIIPTVATQAPAKPTISKITTGKKSMTVKMSKKPASYKGNGFQIRYRIVGTKTWKTVKTTAQSKTIKKLKKGKKYYVQVRTYKGSQYSSWSSSKKTGKIK